MKTLRIIGVIATVWGVASLGWAAPAVQPESLTALDVVTKMDKRYDGDTSTARMTMVLINQAGTKRTREIASYSKDFGQDEKGILFFLSPADVKDTAYLSYDWEDDAKENDSWLYLPALRKVKRIAGSDESGAFMGSDFSYADINGIELSDWNYTFVNKDDEVDGFPAWQIEAKPKPDRMKDAVDKTGYLKYRMWIRKDNFMAVRGKYWVDKGRKIKYFTANDIKQIDSIWTATSMTMITTARGQKEHETLLSLSDIVYNTPLDDDVFSTVTLERGVAHAQ